MRQRSGILAAPTFLNYDSSCLVCNPKMQKRECAKVVRVSGGVLLKEENVVSGIFY